MSKKKQCSLWVPLAAWSTIGFSHLGTSATIVTELFIARYYNPRLQNWNFMESKQSTQENYLYNNILWKLMVGRWNFRLKWSLFTGHVNFRGGRRFCNIYSLTARCEAFRNTAKLWQIWTKSDGLNSHAGDHAGTKPCAYLSNLSACLYQHADLQEMPNSGPRSSLVPTLCHPWRPCFLLHPQIHIRADPRWWHQTRSRWEKNLLWGH